MRAPKHYCDPILSQDAGLVSSQGTVQCEEAAQALRSVWPTTAVMVFSDGPSVQPLRLETKNANTITGTRNLATDTPIAISIYCITVKYDRKTRTSQWKFGNVFKASTGPHGDPNVLRDASGADCNSCCLSRPLGGSRRCPKGSWRVAARHRYRRHGKLAAWRWLCRWSRTATDINCSSLGASSILWPLPRWECLSSRCRQAVTALWCRDHDPRRCDNARAMDGIDAFHVASW